MDYFEIFPADEFQAEQLDAYFSANAENGVSKLDIIHLLEKINWRIFRSGFLRPQDWHLSR